MSKRIYKVLIVHDVEKPDGQGGVLRWAYAHRSASLKRYAPDDMRIDRCSHAELDYERLRRYDLVFFLDYAIATSYRQNIDKRGIDIVMVTSFNKDANSRHELWKSTLQSSDFVVVNNLHRWEHGGRATRTCCLSNGVDTHDWYCEIPIEQRENRVLWCGSTGPAKRKGYREIIEPLRHLAERQGFSFDLRPIDDIHPDVVFGTDRQRQWYNSGAFYLNAGETEGTPSAALEAMACGCIYISTYVGNVREFGAHRFNCLIAEPTAESFLQQLLYARVHRRRLSDAAIAQMRNWRYGGPNGRAQWFYQMFRRLIDDGPESVKPFCCLDTHWTDI